MPHSAVAEFLFALGNIAAEAIGAALGGRSWKREKEKPERGTGEQVRDARAETARPSGGAERDDAPPRAP